MQVQTQMENVAQKMSEFKTKKEQYSYCHDLFCSKRQELYLIEQIMIQTRQEMEDGCKHEWEKDWENRDERSRWKCKHCTKFR